MPMSSKQFRTALKALGLSQMEAARRLHVDPRTVRRWALGEAKRGIPEPVVLLIRTWVAAGRHATR